MLRHVAMTTVSHKSEMGLGRGVQGLGFRAGGFMVWGEWLTYIGSGFHSVSWGESMA